MHSLNVKDLTEVFLKYLSLDALTPPCSTFARNFPHGHFLFYDILMSEQH